MLLKPSSSQIYRPATPCYCPVKRQRCRQPRAGCHRRHNTVGAHQQELTSLCHTIQQSYYEGCVENAGRPAAAALADLVRAAACAFKDGHSMDKLRLEVEHGGLNEVHLKSGTCCLTETDKHYRRQFLDTVYITMQMLMLRDEGFDKSVATALTWQREWTEDDWSILNIIDTVLTGQATGEEQMAVQLDRALATSGWSPSCISAMKAPRIANYVGVNELMQPGCTCAFVPTVIPYLSEYRLWVLTTTASTASLHNGKTQMRREVSSSVWIQEHQEGQLLLTGQLPLNLFQFRSWS